MVPGAFVVDLLEDTGTMGRGEAELLMTWLEWVEVEVQGVRPLRGGAAQAEGGRDGGGGGLENIPSIHLLEIRRLNHPKCSPTGPMPTLAL